MAGTLIALMTSLFTGLSVLVAVWVYRRTEDQRTFAAFRLSLVDLRQNIRELDSLLAEPLFVEIGLAISEDLRQLFPTTPSKDEIKQYVTDKQHHDFISTAIHTGRRQSSTLRRCEKLVTEIERNPFIYREQLPVVSHALSKLITYISRTALGVSSARIFNEIIGNPERFSELTKAQFDTDKVSDVEAFRYIGLMLGMVPVGVMRATGQKLFDATEQLMVVIIESYTGMADKELRKHGRRQRRMLKKVEEIREDTPVKYAFEYLKLIRGVFAQNHRWDEIVATVTIVEQETSSDD